MEEFKGVTRMNKIVFNIHCLDGNYELNVDYDESTLHYEIVTDIEYLESKTGDLDSKDFLERIEKINLNKLEQNSSIQDVEIEDPVLWKLEYAIDTKTSCIEGKEGNWPYNYDELIEVLMLIDEKLIAFKANKK